MGNDILAMLERIPKFDEKSGVNSKNLYNIFEVMGVEYNEVIVCRFIGNLLDPKGGHGLGSEPLRHFIRDVLKEIPSHTLENAMVVLEEHIANDRRVDIAIHLQDKVYPIEVKIWAGDQNKQLEDYYKYFFDENGTGKIYYLTPDGHAPSEKSWGKPSDKVHCISFSKDIKDWLNEIKKTASERIEFVIENYVEVIEKMCKQSNERDEIIYALELNKEKWDTAEIKKAIKLLEYRDEIWDKIRKNYIRGILFPGGYEIDECEKDHKDTTAGISYVMMFVKEKENGKTKAWICVETNLYIVAKKKQDGTCSTGWKELNKDYQWKYIDDYHNKHIQLKNPTEELPNINVNLEDLLKGID